MKTRWRQHRLRRKQSAQTSTREIPRERAAAQSETSWNSLLQNGLEVGCPVNILSWRRMTKIATCRSQFPFFNRLLGINCRETCLDAKSGGPAILHIPGESYQFLTRPPFAPNFISVTVPPPKQPVEKGGTGTS